MIDKKRLVTFGISLVVFTGLYLFATWRIGSSPGLLIPSVFFFLSWFLGQVITESLFLKDKARWGRMVATVGGFAAVMMGVGYIVVVDHQFSPVTLGLRSLVDLAFGYGAVAIGMKLPRFRRIRS